MTFDFDLFVIGGGSGGVRAARIAASEYGAKVGLAEESRMGGTCVIRGCVPKKLMLFASTGGASVAEARGYGWTRAEAGPFNWTIFRRKLDAELNRLEGLYRQGLSNAGVTIHDQRARMIDPHTVALADGTRLTSRYILIATGGRPTLPDFEGAEHALISDDLFLLDTLPGKVLIVGGGFIACEFATILAGMGAAVMQVHRGPHVLRGFDEMGRELVGQQLREIGVDLRLSQTIARIELRGQTRHVTFADRSTGDFDAVIVATGRHPNTAGLGAAEAGVTLGPFGQILVDEWSQTNLPSVYAVGDVTDRVNLTPVAIREGHGFADTVFGAKPRKVDHRLVASAVYTRPHELGCVGLTEDEAAKHRAVDVYATSFRPMRSLFAGSEAKAAMKLVVDSETRKVLGGQIFAPEAGEMVQLVAVAMGMGATKEDFDATIAVHPTLAEELVTMRNVTRRVGPHESVPAA
ncbi:glutathione-disulfide reductase [Paracoccus pacificus]|uniref:Glutathione-disulfide reductase n=1 Tax=Paracoccus pacificus TaxID=1463598 RepID=A0ABW4RB66_9RHOB